jgi:hypothetical protein
MCGRAARYWQVSREIANATACSLRVGRVILPRSTSRSSVAAPARLRAPCRLHQFDSRTFDLERELLDVGARRPLGLNSAERSILGAVRLRYREGSDVAWQALRRWLNQPGASPARLTELAQRFPHARARTAPGSGGAAMTAPYPRHHRRTGISRPAQEGSARTAACVQTGSLTCLRGIQTRCDGLAGGVASDTARLDADHRSSGPRLRSGGKEGTLPGRRTWTSHGVALLGNASRRRSPSCRRIKTSSG